MKRINLISGPRNVSTAFMYSFAQRGDTRVLDEPFYAFYLAKSKIDHPGKDDVLKSQPIEEAEVWSTIFQLWDRPVLFIKNMAHHMELLNDSHLDKLLNIFLIRDPHQIIASYAQVIEKPVMRDIGLAYQYELFSRLKTKSHEPIVIDSGLLLESPAAVLKQMCDRIGIEFTTDMLHWPEGPKPFDGVWASYWYANVHASSGWQKQRHRHRTLPESLEPLYEQARSYYEKLLPFSLKP